MKWDQFEDRLRGEFPEYESAVDPQAIFDRLEPGLNELQDTKKKKRRFFFWIFFVGGALLLAGGLTWAQPWSIEITSLGEQDHFFDLTGVAIAAPIQPESNNTPEIEASNTSANQMNGSTESGGATPTPKLATNKASQTESVVKEGLDLSTAQSKVDASESTSASLIGGDNTPPNQPDPTTQELQEEPMSVATNLASSTQTSEEATAKSPATEEISAIHAEESVVRNPQTIEELAALNTLVTPWLSWETELNRKHEKWLSQQTEESRQPKPVFFLETSFGLAQGGQILSAKTDDAQAWLSLRDSTERVMEALQANILLTYQTRKPWTFSTGLQFQQINHRTEIDQALTLVDYELGIVDYIVKISGDTVANLGEIPVVRTQVVDKRFYNQFRQWQIPVKVGYNFATKNWLFAPQVGVAVNIRSRAQGTILQESFLGEVENYALEQQENERVFLKPGIQLAYTAGLSVIRPIGKKVDLAFRLEGQWMGPDVSGVDNPIGQQFWLVGGQVGLRYRLH